jgi:hypothetical protein
MLLALALCSVAGCGPPGSEEPRADDLALSSPAALKPSGGGVPDGETAAIRIARQWPADDSDGAVEDWVRRRMDAERGSVLFPRWRARRLGVDKYEVSFDYTVVDEKNTIQRRGIAWRVDVSLKMVSGFREMTPAELVPDQQPRTVAPRRSAVELKTD